ncbi:ATP-binding cassette domain-containing protein [Methanolobus profundi]|uniref:Energy-coupling factor transport system ATP-binding protein n=1 Tax=Methanolobus profundi TaxID=487685 RepID=A0A1I4R5W5_9EURY|nr:ATP-binding cassette domain-containing protein [Methanolobus profundi]SFM47330.1 energy-coupling factor transport system ATP-binding protein [Methanolobus profundi]
MSIEVKDLSFCYNRGTSLEKRALDNVSLSIGKGEFVLIGGEIGSGKSTLVRHFNGILKPQSGSVTVSGMASTDRDVRHKAGLLMQYPQKQLFGRTVFEDVSFGPSNFGIKGDALEQRVADALEQAGLGRDIGSLSPFSLSGGQMRLVALAGVLAMQPEYLILDEPTSGLDPENRSSLLATLKELHLSGISVVVVSHQVCEFLPLADKVILLDNGWVSFNGTPVEYVRSVSSPLPEITLLMKDLIREGFDVRDDILSIDDAFEEIVNALEKRGAGQDE